MGRTIISLTTMLGIGLCCAFLAASCVAMAWHHRTTKTAHLRLLVALLAACAYSWFMFNMTMKWERGPGYIPHVGEFATMVGALAVGATLAIRTGTTREVLTATGIGVALGLALVILCIWTIRPPSFDWLAGCVAIVPAAGGLILAPLLLAWRLRPAPPWALLPPHKML